MTNLTNKANLNGEDIQKIKKMLGQTYNQRIKNELEYRACVSRLEKKNLTKIDESMAIELRKDFYNQNYRYIPKTTLHL